MPSSRRTPRRRKRPAGGYGIRPLRPKRRGRWHRPGNGQMGREIPPLRINFMFWANRGGRAVKTNGCRFPGGRRAGCPHPAAPRGGATPAGGYGIRPYDRRRARGQTGNRGANGIANLCRGRCLHRPGNPAAARGSPGGINPAPTNNFYVWANRGGRAVKTNGCRFPGGRRAGCPHPAAPRGGANARGRIWNPPLRPTEGPWSNGEPCGGANARGRAMALPCKPRPMPEAANPPPILIS